MGSDIVRRDSLNGIAITVGASFLGADPFLLDAFGVLASDLAPEKDPN
jgi:hypothetical protein